MCPLLLFDRISVQSVLTFATNCDKCKICQCKTYTHMCSRKLTFKLMTYHSSFRQSDLQPILISFRLRYTHWQVIWYENIFTTSNEMFVFVYMFLFLSWIVYFSWSFVNVVGAFECFSLNAERVFVFVSNRSKFKQWCANIPAKSSTK